MRRDRHETGGAGMKIEKEEEVVASQGLARPSPPPHPHRRSLLRALRGPLAVGGLVALSAAFALPPIRDAATLQPLPAAALHHPPGYLFGAPLFGLWDTLTLLAVSQHYAFLGTMIALYLAQRLLAAARSRDPSSRAAAHRRPGRLPAPLRRLVRELVLATGALAALLACYAAAALIPRPMAALRLHDPDLVAVDFHSHTHRSHDGRARFTAAHSRAWHEAAGFDAAYVTDHYTWAGVDDALSDNPRRAGEGTVLLSGMEVRLRGRHVNILGDRDRYIFALDSAWHRLDPDSIAAASARGGRPPTILYALPGPLDQVVALPRGGDRDHGGRLTEGDGRESAVDSGPRGGGGADAAGAGLGAGSEGAGVIGIELSDGAPRGLEQARRQRAEILALADSLDLAVVAGTNHHGWGRTAPAWSVMRIPGWAEMAPEELDRAIQATLHRERRRAAIMVERRVPWHDGSRIAIAATVPWLLWEQLRMLTSRERVGWMGWVGVWAAVLGLRARRRGSFLAGPSPDGSETAGAEFAGNPKPARSIPSPPT